jgi:hypothetical protein
VTFADLVARRHEEHRVAMGDSKSRSAPPSPTNMRRVTAGQ